MASSIGITLDQFFKLTQRQVTAILKQVTAQKNQEIIMQAKMRGIDIKSTRPAAQNRFNADADDEFLKAAQKRIHQQTQVING